MATTLDLTEFRSPNDVNQTIPSHTVIPMSLSAEMMGETPYLDPFSFFPTTMCLVVLAHLIFLYQVVWLPRKKVVVTYRSIIYKKRFHKLWIAILSHPPTQESASFSSSERESSVWDRDNRSFSPTVAMGGPDYSDQWMQGNGVVHRFMRIVAAWGTRQWNLLTKGSLSGFPLLLYNSHILWSCRALEQVYNEEDSWRYMRCIISLVILTICLELCISHALVKATLRRQRQQPSDDAFGEIQPTFDGSLDPTFLEQIRQRVEKRTIGTMTMLTSAILVLFRFQYTDVPLAVLPFFPDRFLSKYPAITYLVCIAILAVLARSNHPMGVVTGALVGLGWMGFSLDYLADSYHGNCLVFVAVLLSLLSCKGQYPNMLPCIEYVSWYDADVAAATTDEPMTRPLSWCFQPVLVDQDDTSSEGQSDDSSINRAEEALLEFSRVRSDSDSQEASVDPDLLEQGRRPRRTRIRSQRP